MTTKKLPIAKRVWDTLSAIDVSGFTEKKQNLTYLSWAHAWGVMMDHFPETDYTFTETIVNDGTVMVECTITVKDGDESLARTMWLPVMNYKNQAITNPDAFAINTARMRCLTKCLSMLGLGVYIYQGEDLPRAVQEAHSAPITKEQYENLMRGIEATETDPVKFCKAFDCQSVETMTGARYEEAMSMLKRKAERLIAQAEKELEQDGE